MTIYDNILIIIKCFMHTCISKKNSQKPAIDFQMVKQALVRLVAIILSPKCCCLTTHIIARIGRKLFLFYLAFLVSLLVYFLIRQKFMDFLSCFILARKIFFTTIMVPKDFYKNQIGRSYLQLVKTSW